MDASKTTSYVKASLVFTGLFVFVAALYIAQRIIVPVIYATIIAIVLSPLVDFLVRKKMNRVLAITTALIILGLVVALLGVFLGSQLSVFSDAFPKLLDKFSETLNNLILWASNHFNISTQRINDFIGDTKTEILNGSRDEIGSTLATVGSVLSVIVIIPVYIFMILFYQPLLLEFIRRLFGSGHRQGVEEVLTSTKTIIRKYLVALLFEAAIVAALNAAALFIIGVEYALLLGVIGAILNVIPYIGGIVAVALPMLVAFATKSSPAYALLVMLAYIIIQFIDNHYIIPKVVASKVRINALISITVVLAGNAMWGIPGMFLSIPLTAILKVICDHIDNLKPWGFLLGDTMPVTLFKIAYKKKTD